MMLGQYLSLIHISFVNMGKQEALEGSDELFILKLKAKRKVKFDLNLKDGILVEMCIRDRLSFGQGLVISTDYLLGKTVYASSFNTRSGGIRKHSSTDETNYFLSLIHI